MKYFIMMVFLLIYTPQNIHSETLYGTLNDGRSVKLDTETKKWEFFTGVTKGKISVKFLELKEKRNGKRCSVVFEVTNATDLHFDRIQNTFIIRAC